MQRRSLGGFTFAFNDYLDAGVVDFFDKPKFADAMQIVDPAFHLQSLSRLPKLAIVSSDDEFMQLDWTQSFEGPGSVERGWTKLPGESHLLVVPNSEHSMATGIPEVIESMCAFIGSLDHKQSRTARPKFTTSRDAATGALTVRIPPGFPVPSKAVLRHTQTLSHKRRDFRWVRMASSSSPFNEPCTLPGVPIKPMFGGGDCAQPMFYIGETLTPLHHSDNSTTFEAHPKEPHVHHWRAYFVEMYYPNSITKKAELKVSTPGYVWPDTFPAMDCNIGEPGCAIDLL